MNENDQKRLEILSVFYDANKNARNDNMKYLNSQLVKHKCDLTIQEINEHITYLHDSGHLKPKTERGLTRYRISNKGIDYFEDHSSEFRRPGFSFNVNNANGIVVIGNNNFVQQKYHALYNDLQTLQDLILKTSELNDSEKVEFQAEVNTIKSQLAKINPDKSIIGKSWAVLEKLASIEGVSDLILKLTPIVVSLLQ